MKIQTSKRKIKYNRSIENMGEKTILFKVKHNSEYLEVINHFCYYNKDNSCIAAKLPLDLAICSPKMNVEYISFFCEKKFLFYTKVENKIIYLDDSILITDERFTFDKRYIDIKMEFNYYIQNRDVFVISKNAQIDLIGYRIDDNHYILFDKEDNFSGVVFKNLNDVEMSELEKSNLV